MTQEPSRPGSPLAAAAWDAAEPALDALGIGLWRLDADLRYVRVSSRGLETLGLPWADAVGQGVFDVWPHFAHDEEQRLLLEATAAGGSGGAMSRWGSVRQRWLHLFVRPVAGGGLVILQQDLPDDVVLRPGGDAASTGAAEDEARQTLAVLRLAETLNGLTEPTAVARVAAAELPAVFGADACHVVVGPHARVRVPEAAGPVRESVLEAAALAQSAGRLTALDRPAGEHVVAVPVVVAGEHLCALVLVFEAGAALTSGELRLLHVAAALWGQAFVRADAHARDVEQALALQRSLLPSHLPSDEGADVAAAHRAGSAALSVGGDFYDAVRTEDGSLLLVIGDVQGHDLDAVALMGQMRAAIRSSLLLELSPAQVLAQADRYLVQLDTELLVSACVVQVHPGQRWATVASAGHLAPWTGSQGLLEDLPVAPPLGVGPVADGWQEVTVPLADDDVVVLVSDGLVESRSLDVTTGLGHLSAALEALVRDGAGTTALVSGLLATPPLGSGTDDVTVLAARTTAPASSAGADLPEVRRRLPASAQAVPLARRFTADVAAQHLGRSGAAASQAGAALSAVDAVTRELVANAVRHSSTAVEVRLSASPTALGLRLRVAVADDDPRVPLLREPASAEAVSELDAAVEAGLDAGQGLRRVAALASRWGCSPEALGKAVWAEVEVEAPRA